MSIKISIERQSQTKKELYDEMLETVNAAVGGIWEELVNSTPVKTGNARASWQVVKKGSSGNFLPYGPKYPKPTLSMPSISASDLGIEIINSAAHLHELNYGNLTRPPLLFVELALERAARRVV